MDQRKLEICLVLPKFMKRHSDQTYVCTSWLLERSRLTGHQARFLCFWAAADESVTFLFQIRMKPWLFGFD